MGGIWMERYQKFVHLFVFILIVALAFNVEDLSMIMKEKQPVSMSVHNDSKIEDPLYKEIVAKSSSFYEAPQDAYIDRVWKKTPGRNGLQVNVPKSYEKMKKEKVYNQSLLVFEQIEPKVSLQDIGPAPIYRGHPERQMVALMINVSWGTEYIPDILNILNEQKVKATFFIEGKWAKEHTNLVKMIDEQGHTIGNHAYNHPDMARLSNQENADQIIQTNNIIEAIIGKNPRWFAPPSGSYTDDVVEAAHHLNMETILWTVDTVDWKNPSVSVMINRVMSNVHPGAMILMHPTLPVVKGLDQMIEELKKLDYQINTVDTLLSSER
jgi:probable sporulation protein (polysaccharide deacetylase family)